MWEGVQLPNSAVGEPKAEKVEKLHGEIVRVLFSPFCKYYTQNLTCG